MAQAIHPLNLVKPAPSKTMGTRIVVLVLLTAVGLGLAACGPSQVLGPKPTLTPTTPPPTPTPLPTLTLDEATVKEFAITDFDAVHSPVNGDTNQYLIFGNLQVAKPAADLAPELAAFLGRWEGYDTSPPIKKNYKLVLVVQDISDREGRAFLWLGNNLQYPSQIQEVRFRVIHDPVLAIEFRVPYEKVNEKLSLVYDSDRKIITDYSRGSTRQLELGQDRSFFVYKDYAQYLAGKGIVAKDYQNKELAQYGKGYLLYLPEGYDEDTTKTWPLLFFLHGYGDSGDNVYLIAKASPFMMIREQGPLPFIIVAPQVTMAQADRDGFPVAYMAGVLAEAQSTYRVDPKRIYLTGLSMGGNGTWRFALSQPDTFAAVAPLCAWIDPGLESKLDGLKNVPVWAIHGTDDLLVSQMYGERPVKVLQELGGNVKFTALEGYDHDVWTVTYSDPKFYDWLLQQQKP